MLEAERSETASLNVELRNTRLEIERVEREKRLASHRASFGPSAPHTPHGMYRPYTYTYPSQSYRSASQLATSASSATYLPSPTQPASFVPSATGTIPVQLPATSLGALTTLGIVPVPVSALPPPDQPQPPAILKGATENGTLLSLEINISLLQSVQMSGLAMVLNSLVRNADVDGTANAVAPSTTTSSQSTSRH
jgi:hypothetical protein